MDHYTEATIKQSKFIIPVYSLVSVAYLCAAGSLALNDEWFLAAVWLVGALIFLGIVIATWFRVRRLKGLDR